MAHKTTLFLASSKELEADRKVFEEFIGRRNKQWQDDGIFLHLDVWEDFDDAMAAGRKQDDYNDAIRKADIFVLLVHTKVGKFTREEFEAAWAQFQQARRPRIYTYVKRPVDAGDPEPGPDYATVRALQTRLAELQHWPNRYDDAESLLLHFSQQLDKLRNSGFIKADKAGASPGGHSANTGSSGNIIARGAGAQAGGAGAVIIGGGNSGPINTGQQKVVHTSGGAYVRDVNISHGDFVGRDKIVHGVQGQDLATLFAALRKEVEKHAPDPADAQLAWVNLDALRAEAAKPEGKRNDKLMARLIDAVVALVPGAIGAVVSAFGSPLLAGVAGPTVAAVLQRLGLR